MAKKNRPSEIAASDLLALIKSGTAPTIVDVRSEREFREGHVRGATLVPFWKLLAGSSTIPASVDDRVVLYCGHGPRARMAGAALRRKGFKRIEYLKGHMAEWRRLALPLESS